MYRFAAACIACAVLMSPAISSAAARVKSHSNTNNNRFSAQCASLGGKTTDGSDGTTCVLPAASGQPSMAVKGAGVPTTLSAACAQDGGKIVQKGGGVVCQSGAPMN